MKIPIDPATGRPHKPGEYPLGWNEPIPDEESDEESDE